MTMDRRTMLSSVPDAARARQYAAFYAGNGRSFNAGARNAGKPEEQGEYGFALQR
jgi:hypothetical protein